MDAVERGEINKRRNLKHGPRDPERLEEWEDLYRAGVPTEEIGKRYGVTGRSVRSHLRRFSAIELRWGKPKSTRYYNPIMQVRIDELYRQGWPQRKIAEHLGVTIYKVRYVMNRYGKVPIRPGGRGVPRL